MLELRKYDPFPKVMRDMEQMMMRHFGPTRGYEEETAAGLCVWNPRMDVNERKDEWVVRLDIPGMKQEEIKVTLDNSTLVISGERQFEQNQEKDNFHRVECLYGAFSRSLTLPRSVNTEKIGATYRDGVLELILPKREESKPKQVEIKIG